MRNGVTPRLPTSSATFLSRKRLLTLPPRARHTGSKTHRSWSGVRDSVLVWSPVMLRLLPVGVRTVKSSSDVIHLIDTHCKAFKHSAVRKEKKQHFGLFSNQTNGQDNFIWMYFCRPHDPHLVVLKSPKISGFFPSLLLSTNTSSGTPKGEFNICFSLIQTVSFSNQ